MIVTIELMEAEALDTWVHTAASAGLTSLLVYTEV